MASPEQDNVRIGFPEQDRIGRHQKALRTDTKTSLSWQRNRGCAWADRRDEMSTVHNYCCCRRAAGLRARLNVHPPLQRTIAALGTSVAIEELQQKFCVQYGVMLCQSSEDLSSEDLSDSLDLA